MIYDRKTRKTSAEKVYKDGSMQFLYNTTLGGVCVFFLRLPIVSRIYGMFQRTRRSKKKIDGFAQEYGIDMSRFESGFQSFNDFIIRKRTNPEIDATSGHLIAPADSCLLAYTIHGGEILSVKNKNYTLSEFLKDAHMAREYDGGSFLVFRLRVYDYHRFCFIDDGTVISLKRIRGFLDSVNNAATGRFALSSNYREISVLKTAGFGDVVFVEVGAMLVGRIIQTHNTGTFNKGDEKGYFEFGGSSIVVLLKKGVADIDGDILEYSAKGIETTVEYGERIGTKRA